MSFHQFTDMEHYFTYLTRHDAELERLADALMIPVSRFFRNPVVFDLVFEQCLPLLLDKKMEKKAGFRFWSAGCSRGEEAYSLAICGQELLKREQGNLLVNVFATDISEQSLKFARQGVYNDNVLYNIRYGWLRKYFHKRNHAFEIIPQLKQMVYFSRHDLLDPKKKVPTESIFGAFDLVFCRNVLIYYELAAQQRIISCLENSLIPGGYLVLGESESLLAPFQKNFQKIYHGFSIYQKQ